MDTKFTNNILWASIAHQCRLDAVLRVLSIKKTVKLTEEKEKRAKGKETGKEEVHSFWKDWANFLANNKNFHPFSPEFHNSDIQEYKKAIREVPTAEDNEELAFDFLEAIFRAVHAFHTSRLEINEGESTFNSLFINLFLKVVADAVALEMVGSRSDFLPGEVNLKAMSKQLKELENSQGDRDRYMADGTMETFRSIKVFFIHAAKETLYLWSLRFEPEGPVYELWLEDMLLIKPDIEDKLEAMPAIINFFWNFEANITCTLILKKENAAALIKSRFEDVEFESLSSMVNASILKLTEEDKARMSALGPFYSNPSSPN
ncbi:hypothetical protein G6F59_010742 [Rhizopus arrhizus]|nr:hypothetical protein G6F59_010742 [Rhizopus arrhizus]